MARTRAAFARRARGLPATASHRGTRWFLAAEAAGLVGGADGFWGMHRWLFEREVAAVCTDTGIITPLLEQRLLGCELLLLETNHDKDMLRHGPYPWPLKQRIDSRTGHLSNHQSFPKCAFLVYKSHNHFDRNLPKTHTLTTGELKIIRKWLS